MHLSLKLKQMQIGSQLVVNYVDTKTLEQSSVNSLSGCVCLKYSRMEKIGNGVCVLYDFKREKESFSIPVNFILKDDYFEASIDFSRIKEYGNSKIVS